MNWKIQTATSQNLKKIVTLEQELQPVAWSFLHFQEELKTVDPLFWVALQHQEVRGYLVAHGRERVIEVLKIVVEKKFQRQGIAQSLMQTLVQYAQAQQMQSIYLNVRVSHFGAILFYEKQGFQKQWIRKGFYQDQEDAYEMVLMFKAC